MNKEKNKIAALACLLISLSFISMVLAFYDTKGCGCFDCTPCFNISFFGIFFAFIGIFFAISAVWLISPFAPNSESLSNNENKVKESDGYNNA